MHITLVKWLVSTEFKITGQVNIHLIHQVLPTITIFILLAMSNPLLTLEDFSASGLEMGAKIATLNCHGWDYQYVGLKTAFDVILDDMFEIVGDELKLTR